MSTLLIFILVLVFIIGGLLVFRDTANISSKRGQQQRTDGPTSHTAVGSDSSASSCENSGSGCDGGGGDGGGGD